MIPLIFPIYFFSQAAISNVLPLQIKCVCGERCLKKEATKGSHFEVRFSGREARWGGGARPLPSRLALPVSVRMPAPHSAPEALLQLHPQSVSSQSKNGFLWRLNFFIYLVDFLTSSWIKTSSFYHDMKTGGYIFPLPHYKLPLNLLNYPELAEGRKILTIQKIWQEMEHYCSWNLSDWLWSVRHHFV